MRGGGRTVALALILLILLPFTPSTPTTHSTQTYWAEFNMTPATVVLYDYDGDGYREVVTSSGIVEDSTVIASPYRGHYLALVDIDGDLEPELVSWGNGTLHAYEGMSEVWNTTVPNTGNYTVLKYALIIGDTIVWNETTLTLPQVGGYLLATPRTLILIYNEGGALYAWNLISNQTLLIYNDSFTPLGALIDYPNLYIAAVSPAGTLAEITYHLDTHTPEISVYTVVPQRLVAVDYAGRSFYIQADNMLYRLTGTGVILVSTWEPRWADNTYIYLYSQEQNKVAVYSVPEKEVKKVYTLPRQGEAPVLVAAYPSTTLVYSNATYIATYTPAPTISMSTPYGATAGTPFTVVVFASNADEIELLVDGLPATLNGTVATIEVDEPGWHNITAIASNQYASTKVTSWIYVRPRPLALIFDLLKPPTPTQQGEAVVKARDTITGEEVNTTCNVTTPTGTMQTRTGVPFLLQLPENLTNLTIPLHVECGGGVYEVVDKDYTVEVPKIPVNITISYLGNGTIHVEVVDVLGRLVEGTVKLVIGTLTDTEYNPANFTLQPGEYRARLVFTPTSPLYRGLAVNVNLTVLGPVENVSAMNLSKYSTVLVVDHVINKTIIHNITQTVTQNITKCGSPLATTVSPYILAGAVVVAVVVVLILLKVKRGGGEAGVAEI